MWYCGFTFFHHPLELTNQTTDLRGSLTLAVQSQPIFEGARYMIAFTGVVAILGDLFSLYLVLRYDLTTIPTLKASVQPLLISQSNEWLGANWENGQFCGHDSLTDDILCNLFNYDITILPSGHFQSSLMPDLPLKTSKYCIVASTLPGYIIAIFNVYYTFFMPLYDNFLVIPVPTSTMPSSKPASSEGIPSQKVRARIHQVFYASDKIFSMIVSKDKELILKV